MVVRWPGLDGDLEGIALCLPARDGSFSPGQPSMDAIARTWTLTAEQRRAKEATLRWAPGRYELLIGSDHGIAGRLQVEFEPGALVTATLSE